MDTAGLALLTQALMDSQPDPVDTIISLPLPEPLPPEQEVISTKEGEMDEAGAGMQQTDDILNLPGDQPAAELLPPISFKGKAPLFFSDATPTDITLENGVIKDVIVDKLAKPAEGGDIAAYFALEFLDMQYIYYLQRSSVSLGRSSNDSSGPVADIDLGPLKNISRLHARIEYEEELERFVLAVIGRNGAFVNGIWQEPGRRVPLEDRSMIQISTRAFNFILPHSSSPTSSDQPHQHEGISPHEPDVPALDSTITTAEDDDSHSTSASATPKQNTYLRRKRIKAEEQFDEGEDGIEVDLEEMSFYQSLGGKGKGKGKGRGKGKEALIPPKRGRGRPRKSSFVSKVKSTMAPQMHEGEDEEEDLEATAFLSESESDGQTDDRDGDFVPKRRKGRPKRHGGLGKVRGGTLGKISIQPIIVKDEEMSQEDGEELEEDVDASMDDPSEPMSPSVPKRMLNKRKREQMEPVEEVLPEKRRRITISSKTTETNQVIKNAVKKKKKGSKKTEMKSLFTTTPVTLPSVTINTTTDGVEAEGDPKGKAAGKKLKGNHKKGKKTTVDEEEDGEEKKGDGEGDEDAEPKEEAKPAGPPPPKPPFTYPLLCYRALKALNGKAPYRAITKWLETEYPYFAAATKEGKDGWENSTRHTLSSHRAFIKIDRKPEERGKGCFWSFDPEFEEQFKDQWRAAESQARNPRPTGRPPNAPAGPHGPFQNAPGMYVRPPFPHPPPGWQGVTPPHLMPGYRPMPGPPGSAPYPYPPMHRPPGMIPPHPMHPMGAPPGHPMIGSSPNGPPHLLGPGTSQQNKNRPPKKPKQALGAAFSRAPLIRPGLGGVPPRPGEGADEIVIRGEHVARMAARAAKDESAGRAPPGTGLAAATGGWGMGGFPPPLTANGVPKPIVSPVRPIASSKITIVLSSPPPDAPMPMLPPPPTRSHAKSDSVDESEKDGEGAKAESPTPSAPRPVQMPMVFYNATLYINPKAYPQLTAEDAEKMTDMTIADAMSYLSGKCSPMVHKSSPSDPSPSTNPKEDQVPTLKAEDSSSTENDMPPSNTDA
ncbi:Pre-rRNA-processing protein fhl1 [Serendipita sp. 398]|nr:Pre-rRNA-processing protein fhl1 [Serendipita sp. 398]